MRTRAEQGTTAWRLLGAAQLGFDTRADTRSLLACDAGAPRQPHEDLKPLRTRLNQELLKRLLGPGHLTISGQPGLHPQASCPAHAPDPRPPLLPLRGRRQAGDNRPVTSQHLRATAHVIIWHGHYATLTCGPVAGHNGNRNLCAGNPPPARPPSSQSWAALRKSRRFLDPQRSSVADGL
jgi:hypothetical protein